LRPVPPEEAVCAHYVYCYKRQRIYESNRVDYSPRWSIEGLPKDTGATPLLNGKLTITKIKVPQDWSERIYEDGHLLKEIFYFGSVQDTQWMFDYTKRYPEYNHEGSYEATLWGKKGKRAIYYTKVNGIWKPLRSYKLNGGYSVKPGK
tara:strand:- start:239 stop:682 length:444 start_codon:yes stop_codon:yes gene_type:complete